VTVGAINKKGGAKKYKMMDEITTFASPVLLICDSFFENKVETQSVMKYRVDKQDHYAVLTLDEENLNSSIAPKLKSDLIIFGQEGIHSLILDLTNVKFVDSSGLSAILTGHRLWKDSGVFVLSGEMQPMVRKLIEISRLETILVMIPNLDEAVDYVKMEALERELLGEEE
jgi:anti-sigma B factor antagonist